MPHPEQEHALMIEVARLRKEADGAHARERHLIEALAAARRECDLYRKALREISERIDSKKNPQAARARGIAAEALAAPAAGPDLSHAALEAEEKRLQREVEVNDPNESDG